MKRDWKIIRWGKDLYHWVLRWADHHHNTKALCFVSFIESIFFPIPTDALLIAMGTSRPKRALWYAFLATVTSVAGGLAGYYIGWQLWDLTRDFFIPYVFSLDTFTRVQTAFQENAFIAVFTASFTPIPFKAVTITGGVAELNILTFTLAAILGRGSRFFLVGSMFFIFGKKISDFIERHFEKLVIAFTILFFLGLYAMKFLF